MVSIKSFSKLVVLQHSVFALPFALASFLLADSRNHRFPLSQSGIGMSVSTGLLVIACVVFARTAAMAFNRYLDSPLDAENPRTATREIPSGEVSRAAALAITIGSSIVFLLGAGLLGLHCLVLAPFVLTILLGYSYAKRYTPYSHFVLGLALALAPGGAWWVLRPAVEALPLLLMLGVTLWVGGFDILYSCQDIEFDREHNLRSVPQTYGLTRALQFARWSHWFAFLCFLALAAFAELGSSYVFGVLVIGVLLVWQHRLVTAWDLSRINRAFFTFNGIISVFYFLVVVFVRR